jgi:mannonate dehydratase
LAADVPALVHRFARHIVFIHVRDVRGDAASFAETFPDEGQTDMAAVVRAYRDIGIRATVAPMFEDRVF